MPASSSVARGTCRLWQPSSDDPFVGKSRMTKRAYAAFLQNAGMGWGGPRPRVAPWAGMHGSVGAGDARGGAACSAKRGSAPRFAINQRRMKRIDGFLDRVIQHDFMVSRGGAEARRKGLRLAALDSLRASLCTACLSLCAGAKWTTDFTDDEDFAKFVFAPER